MCIFNKNNNVNTNPSANLRIVLEHGGTLLYELKSLQFLTMETS